MWQPEEESSRVRTRRPNTNNASCWKKFVFYKKRVRCFSGAGWRNETRARRTVLKLTKQWLLTKALFSLWWSSCEGKTRPRSDLWQPLKGGEWKRSCKAFSRKLVSLHKNTPKFPSINHWSSARTLVIRSGVLPIVSSKSPAAMLTMNMLLTVRSLSLVLSLNAVITRELPTTEKTAIKT